MVIALLTARELPARVAHSLPDAWRTRRGRPQPAGVNGIPHSFVVGRDNRILFSGHPMDPNFDAAIRKGVAAAAGPPPTPVAQSARVTDPIKATREELLAMSKFQDFICTAKAKMEAVKDEQRLKTTITKLRPLVGDTLAKENRALIDAIKRYVA